jgi:NAD(P)-dependent dehydrogenase (short-subunit alcohol dehydrogenase family)
VRRPDQVEGLLDAVAERFGKLDVLVNNAAGNFVSPTERLSHRAFDAIIGIVLHGTVYCTLEQGKCWIKAHQPGVVLNIATTYAQSGSGYVVPSAVAKAGVVSLTKSLAAEWGKYGIRLISPPAPSPPKAPGAA